MSTIVSIIFLTFILSIIPFLAILSFFCLIGKKGWDSCRFPRTYLYEHYTHCNPDLKWPDNSFRDDRLSGNTYDQWQESLMKKDNKEIYKYYENLYQETKKSIEAFYQEMLDEYFSQETLPQQKENQHYFMFKQVKNEKKYESHPYYIWDDEGNVDAYSWKQNSQCFIPTSTDSHKKLPISLKDVILVTDACIFKEDKCAILSSKEAQKNIFSLTKHIQWNAAKVEDIKDCTLERIAPELQKYLNK